MNAPYYSDDTVTLHHGDALAVAREMTSNSVACIVTSPPYFGLRDYGADGQYGLESTPAEYVEVMRALFSELWRVVADDGTCWINLGDSYASATKGTGGTGKSGLRRDGRDERARTRQADQTLALQSMNPRRFNMDVPAKNLLGIPWRVAFALQADGWILRNAIVWHKPNAMPESATDRLSTRYETVFMFSRSRRYWFDLDALRQQHEPATVAAATRTRNTYDVPGMSPQMKTRTMHAGGANPRDVWEIPTQPFAAAHFAVMALELAERCVMAGCKPGGIVLDPFSGSGTTGLAAGKHGRKYVGVDINAEYLDLSLRTRLKQCALDFGEAKTHLAADLDGFESFPAQGRGSA